VRDLKKYQGWVPVLALGVAGAVHLSIVAEHFGHTPAHGLFFLGLAVAQLGWTAANFWVRRYDRRLTLWSGLLLSGGVVIVWLLSHVVATPFSAAPHALDAATWATKAAELAAFGVLIHRGLAGQAARRSVTRGLSVMVGGGAAVWFAGLLLTPLLPMLGEGANGHEHGLPVAGVITTSAYFSLVNAGTEPDALVSISGDDVGSITLHQTSIDAQEIARMRPLERVDVTPHTRVDFSPVGRHVMLDAVPRELYEGDSLTLTLHFASGREVPVEFAVTMMEPEARVNFTVVDDFQVSNAWVRATTSPDGLVTVSEGRYEWRLPPGFPLPRVPANNPMTEEKVALGRYLFYDARLSGNGAMACSSCHFQELAFADGQARPVGSTGDMHPRNSMTLTNSAYSATLTWANPALVTIERQVLVPMFGEHPVEMGITGNEDAVLERFRTDALYQTLFASAFPAQDDPFTFNNLTLALASFTRTLISGNSSYDRYLRGERESLSEPAQRGMAMFFSEQLECHHCHTGFNMTLSTVSANSTFEEQPFFNTGLYNIGGTGAYPPDNTGIHEITNNAADMGRFRPPTLRNVALTAPYMHDGSIATLPEVIRFYMDGGRVVTDGAYAGDGRTNPYQSGLVSGFTLSEQEEADLLAFLESLTDESFTTDPRFSNPFVAETQTTQVRR